VLSIFVIGGAGVAAENKLLVVVNCFHVPLDCLTIIFISSGASSKNHPFGPGNNLYIISSINTLLAENALPFLSLKTGVSSCAPKENYNFVV